MGERFTKLVKEMKEMQVRFAKLESRFVRLDADYREFKRLALEIKPEGFNPEDYIGFSLEQLKKLATEKGEAAGFSCKYECERCVKGQRITCWETLTEEADYEIEEGQEGKARVSKQSGAVKAAAR